jgi:hypothetical protein
MVWYLVKHRDFTLPCAYKENMFHRKTATDLFLNEYDTNRLKPVDSCGFELGEHKDHMVGVTHCHKIRLTLT